MNCLIVGPPSQTQALCKALSAEPAVHGRCTTVRLMTLAQRHLLYSTPDLVVVVGIHDRLALQRFSAMVDGLGCDQFLVESADADFAVVRHAGEAPFARDIAAAGLDTALVEEAVRMKSSRDIRARLHAVQNAGRDAHPRGARLASAFSR